MRRSTHLPPPLADPRRRRRPKHRAGRKLSSLPAAASGRRSGPSTPLLRWKFDEIDRPEEEEKPRRRSVAGDAVGVSARRLAAGIWKLQLPDVVGSGRRVGFEPVLGHLQPPHLCNLKTADQHKDSKDDLPSPVSVSSSKSGVFYRFEQSSGMPNPAMEGATKWDPGYSKASEEVYRFYGQLKFLEDQQASAVSIVSALRLDLEKARTHINELEDERHSSKKKLDLFLRKLSEEKAAWRSREHEKVRAVINNMKDELRSERKNRQRMEILNSKLVSELKEAKLSAKRHIQEYEKEKKARELMEEVCDELAKEIGEEKADVETLKRDSMKIREEVEEERRMLQMAEVWREERVQMKLVDAKLTLEEKYMQMCKLQADLQAFLRTHCGTAPATAEMQEAESLIEAVDNVMVHDANDFTYQPPRASEDIFSVFEELQPTEETYDREIEPCYAYSPASRASKVHTVSPEINKYARNPREKQYVNGMVGDEGDAEDDSCWETISQGEDQGFSNSLDGSDPSVNGVFLESNASASGTDWDETAENVKVSNEIVEVCSETTMQSRVKKKTSISRLWNASCPGIGEKHKIIAVQMADGRLSNGRLSNSTLSPDLASAPNMGLSSPSIGQWSSPDSVNPHIARGMKGCIEWPRGIHKQSLKAKLLEARMESQKIQLRHVLKQKS